MIRPDVIVVHPNATDYPMWRAALEQDRYKFNKVFVCLSETYQKPNLSDSITSALERLNCKVLPTQPRRGAEDWRTIAVNACFRLTEAEHVLFIEQDFIFHSESFLSTVLNSGADLVGEKEGGDENNRIHPCFLLAKTAHLKKTSLDFSPKYPLDHFGQITKELQSITPYTSLTSLGLKDMIDYEHLAGLQQNYYLLRDNKIPNYRIERFKQYNQQILDRKLHIIDEFRPVVELAARISL